MKKRKDSTVEVIYFGMQLPGILLEGMFSCRVQQLLQRGVCHKLLISTASVVCKAGLHTCVCSGVLKDTDIKQKCLYFVVRWREDVCAFYIGVNHCESVNTVLTVSLCTDEAGGGAVKEGEEAGHSQAYVSVGWPQVQSGEPGKLNLQNVLWSHLDIRHLHWDITVRLYSMLHFNHLQVILTLHISA